ncbi:hypothetical protein COT08_01275 [Candidatus Woesebacteria bacterium CG07_land_8_20_14_0_80_44_9]|uniref:PDZ domain-containing protein n=2 Tax=Candidatus Woeseibacteriota TaxID=1752722 RepID=A0A2H0BHU8_9BACT|nr:MAG: hypothetical protein COX04_00485 [Candidatus Woesebacteria bacterium CG22_combo_CG10-13_8_21_14_all_45_10]PIU28459.1 MAG: hypothetical protein COT08_01275 [Candidatus Woesebacteria bacterium CG07_land_8_20_14_0_80_44_9]
MPKLNFFKLRKFLLIAAGFLMVFAGGYLLGIKGYRAQIDAAKKIQIVRLTPPDKSDLDFSFFWKVWDSLTAKYFDKEKIDQRAMMYGAISGMVSALGDPYTVFLPPGDNKVMNEDLSGSFEGIGIQIGFKGSQLAVIAPLPDSPAQKAGLKAGDFIVGIKDEVNNVDRGTAGISLPEAVKLIRGKAGTKVALILTREGLTEPFTVEIERAKLEVPSVLLSFVGKDKTIAHLQLLKFGGDTSAQWEEKVSEILNNKDTKGVILDLRNNPGGYLEGAVETAGEFLPVGTLAVIEQGADGVKKEYKTQRTGRLVKIPLVVLVNGGSASAAEILAGALKDNQRAKIVGEKTFGKGSIQEPMDFENGSGLHITIAKWLTPAGVWVNDKGPASQGGLDPDVKIVLDDKTKDDTQLQAALSIFK